MFKYQHYKLLFYREIKLRLSKIFLSKRTFITVGGYYNWKNASVKFNGKKDAIKSLAHRNFSKHLLWQEERNYQSHINFVAKVISPNYVYLFIFMFCKSNFYFGV